MSALAIMQPYFLPYIGYFQLLAAVDRFVILDDVNYINRGWVNRNRLLLNGDAHTFTLPLQSASQNKLICEIQLQNGMVWRDKLLRTIQHAYIRAPYYSEVRPLFENIIMYPTIYLCEMLLHSLRSIVDYLEINTQIIESSRCYENSHLRGQDRIIDIVRKEKASLYINAIGGKALYGSEIFKSVGVDLKFLQPRMVTYRQLNKNYIPWLSIMDILMFNNKNEIHEMLKEYDLVPD